MGTGIHNKEIRKALGRVPGKGLARWRTLGPIVEAIAEGLKFKLSADGADVSEIEGGLHLRITGGSGEDLTPWTVQMGSDAGTRIITPGSLGGSVMPVIGFTRLDATPAPELPIFEGQENYIYLRCQFVATPDGDGFLENVTIPQGNAEVIASNEPLDSDPISALAFCHLGTINALGEVTAQNYSASIEWGAEAFTTGTTAVQIYFK